MRVRKAAPRLEERRSHLVVSHPQEINGQMTRDSPCPGPRLDGDAPRLPSVTNYLAPPRHPRVESRLMCLTPREILPRGEKRKDRETGKKIAGEQQINAITATTVVRAADSSDLCPRIHPEIISFTTREIPTRKSFARRQTSRNAYIRIRNVPASWIRAKRACHLITTSAVNPERARVIPPLAIVDKT